MPFIRKVRILFKTRLCKTRLIFPRINGPNVCPDTEDMLICVIHIPPSRSQRYFIDEFEKVLHSTFMSFLCLILGVFNINTLVKSTIECLELIYSEGFNPLIFVATLITESRTSCIEHILSNFVSSSTSGSIALEITDHLPVFGSFV